MRSFFEQGRIVSLLLIGALNCAGPRASQTPLGGVREVAQPARRVTPPSSASSSPAPLPAVSLAEQQAEARAEETEVVAGGTSPSASAPPADKAVAGAFQLRPYAAGQTWTRVFDLELNVKVGPGGGMDLRMVSHQEARFEVMTATTGTIDRLAIEYLVYTSKLHVMGSSQDSPEELAGKRYVITFPGGKPDVKLASGGTPAKKELDTVQDDAREPLETALALKELAQLAARGKGDFSSAGAVSLAGGQDDDTKISAARAALRLLSTGPRGEKSATVDLAYTLINAADEGSTIEAQLTGTLVALDAPARYHTVSLSGPVELRATDADGMVGSGTIRLSVTYKY